MRSLVNDGLEGTGALLLVLFVAVGAMLLRWQIGQLDATCTRRVDQLAQFEVLMDAGVPGGSAGADAVAMLDGLFAGEQLVCVEVDGKIYLDLRASERAGARP
jgi:hypothetical protein